MTNKRLALLVTSVLSVLTLSCVVLTQSGSFATGVFGSEQSTWRHYSSVEATYNKKGIKEYWTNCNGMTTLENPGDSASDYGAPSDSFISSLDANDERLIPTLYEGCEAIMDGGENMFNVGPHDGTYRGVASWTTSVDQTYGKVYDITLQESGNLQMYLKSKFGQYPEDKYTELFFYAYNANTSGNIALCLDFNWASQTEAIGINPQSWAKISFDASEVDSTRVVWIESWNKIEVTTGWKITPIYGRLNPEFKDELYAYKDGNLCKQWQDDFDDTEWAKTGCNFCSKTENSYLFTVDYKQFAGVWFYTGLNASDYTKVNFKYKIGANHGGNFSLYNTINNWGEIITYQSGWITLTATDTSNVLTVDLSKFAEKKEANGVSNWVPEHNGKDFEKDKIVGFGFNGETNGDLEILSVWFSN